MTPTLKAYYDRLLLEQLIPMFWHHMFADDARVIQLSNGKYKAEWNKWAALGPVTTPLVSGVTPTPSTTSASTVEAIPAQYGSYVPFDDQIDMTSVDPIVSNLVTQCGQQAAESLEIVDRTVLNAGTNVHYANNKLSRASLTPSDKFSALEIDKAVRILENSFVPKIQDQFGGSYIGYVHPDVKFDLREEDDFMAPDKYGSGVQAYSGELGRWNGVRLLNNPMAAKFEGAGAAGIDVYSTLIFGRHWHGSVKWTDATGGIRQLTKEGRAIEVFVRPPGSGDDPLHQRGTVGWKVSHVRKLLNQACGLRVESGSTYS